MTALPFSHPWLLAPAAGLALLALAFGLWAQTRPGVGVRVVGQRPWLLGLGAALVLLGAGAGLAVPRWGLPEVPRLTVHVVLDASRSMLAADAGGTSRWNAAVARLERLWSQPRPGVAYSLDLLTGDSIPMMPPGEDRALLRDALQAVRPGEIGSVGTSLGRGLPQVLAAIDRRAPAVLLLVGDGEETWETEADALARAGRLLKEARLPLYALAVGGTVPQPVPGAAEGEPALSSARPDFLKALAEASGGKLLGPEEDPGVLFQKLASGEQPLPLRRSLQPGHPEWGAWLALAGLACWLFAAGRPLKAWRPVLGLLLLAGLPGRAALPLPQSVRAWVAQNALERGDLETARAYRPRGDRPLHRLVAAQVELRDKRPAEALALLAPLAGQGVPRPLPPWRVPALLLAARAHAERGETEAAVALLERLLQERPGQPEAVHNLQSLRPDRRPPPPKTPPPPPPPRPSQGARQDELEGIKQKLPQKPPPKGIKDL